MKESHSEGVANHTDPESCGKAREGLAEALTGEDAGRAIEPRNFHFGKPTPWLRAEGNNPSAANARQAESREVEDPGTQGHVMHGNREIPGSPERESGRIGKSKDRSR